MREPLIFLDIDGVLNRHVFNHLTKSNTIEPDKVALLNRIIRETGARLVISSAWRYHYHRGEMNLVGLDWLLRSHGVMAGPDEDTPRVRGVTRPDTMVGGKPLPNERGQQIADWLNTHGKRPYVVIDDGGIDPETKEWTGIGIPEAGHPVVWTVGTIGLIGANADHAVAILRIPHRT